MGTLTKVKPEKLNEYIKLHNEIWDEVVREAHRYGLRNFNIFHKDGYLFSYFEYIGDDFERDMTEKNSKPVMKKWREVCNQCFEKTEGQESYDTFLEHIFYNSF